MHDDGQRYMSRWHGVKRAWFTAATSGTSSLGRLLSGSRIAVALGPMTDAIRDTSRNGRSPLRIARTPIASVIARKIGISQPIWNTNPRSTV